MGEASSGRSAASKRQSGGGERGGRRAHTHCRCHYSRQVDTVHCGRTQGKLRGSLRRSAERRSGFCRCQPHASAWSGSGARDGDDCEQVGGYDENNSDITSHPGDPSLLLWTSASLGGTEEKKKVVKQLSEAIAASLSKPEAYVAVMLEDEQEAMMFGGSSEVCALGCVYSIGNINLENNKALMKCICEILGEAGKVPGNRIYINFFDIERQNCGFNFKTFAG